MKGVDEMKEVTNEKVKEYIERYGQANRKWYTHQGSEELFKKVTFLERKCRRLIHAAFLFDRDELWHLFEQAHYSTTFLSLIIKRSKRSR